MFKVTLTHIEGDGVYIYDNVRCIEAGATKHTVVLTGNAGSRTVSTINYDIEVEVIHEPDEQPTREFDVSLSVRVEASSHEQAARTLREWILDPGSEWMFRVTDVSDSRRIEMVDGSKFREV